MAASNQALQAAKRVLDAFQEHGFPPSAVNPSPEGGVMFEHVVHEHYYMIELYNDGGIAYLHRLPDGCICDEDLPIELISDRIQRDIKPLY